VYRPYSLGWTAAEDVVPSERLVEKRRVCDAAGPAFVRAENCRRDAETARGSAGTRARGTEPDGTRASLTVGFARQRPARVMGRYTRVRPAM
jgi:hypothetical protein